MAYSIALKILSRRKNSGPIYGRSVVTCTVSDLRVANKMQGCTLRLARAGRESGTICVAHSRAEPVSCPPTTAWARAAVRPALRGAQDS